MHALVVISLNERALVRILEECKQVRVTSPLDIIKDGGRVDVTDVLL